MKMLKDADIWSDCNLSFCVLCSGTCVFEIASLVLNGRRGKIHSLKMISKCKVFLTAS